MNPSRPPLALLRSAATVLPQRMLSPMTNAVVRGIGRSHPKLFANLACMERAAVHIRPTDLPYGFVLSVGREPVTIALVEERPATMDAQVSASVAVLVDLLEGRIDSDTLFFRRDLAISGNTAVIVGLRNLLDREELQLAAELGKLCGPLRPAARTMAGVLERLLQQAGARVAAMHHTLHPASETQPDIGADLQRCCNEISALTARLAAVEARQKRRNETAS